MAAMLKVSMQKRAFRARARRLVLMVAACCARCRGARRGWRRGGHGERRGRARACRCRGWQDLISCRAPGEVAGQAEAAWQRPQVCPGQTVPGDGGVRARGDCAERVTQRRPGRHRQRRIASPPMKPGWNIACCRIPAARDPPASFQLAFTTWPRWLFPAPCSEKFATVLAEARSTVSSPASPSRRTPRCRCRRSGWPAPAPALS